MLYSGRIGTSFPISKLRFRTQAGFPQIYADRSRAGSHAAGTMDAASRWAGQHPWCGLLRAIRVPAGSSASLRPLGAAVPWSGKGLIGATTDKYGCSTRTSVKYSTYAVDLPPASSPPTPSPAPGAGAGKLEVRGFSGRFARRAKRPLNPHLRTPPSRRSAEGEAGGMGSIR